jgi:hypothetical protein
VQLNGHPRGTGPAAVAEVIAAAAVAVAVEIAGLSGDNDGFTVVATGVFHRAVAFGEFRPGTLVPGQATLSAIGQQRGSARLPGEMVITERIGAASRILSALGHPLRADDPIVTGNIAQVPVCAGDNGTAEIAGPGSMHLTVAGN